MYNFGVITNGISMDLEDAFKALVEAGLRHAELQFLWDKEAGDQTPEEIQRIKQLKESYGVQISCISRHVFAGLPVMTTSAGDEQYRRHLAGLKSCMQMAKELECRLVRIMSFRKEMIIFGFNGAEQWVASSGSCEKLLALMEPAVRLAEEEGITLVVETGNNAMINSGALAKRLVEDLGSRHLRILWDIPNTLYSAEIPYPDAYEEIRDYLGHIQSRTAASTSPGLRYISAPWVRETWPRILTASSSR